MARQQALLEAVWCARSRAQLSSHRSTGSSESRSTGEKDMFLIWWIIVGLIAGWITGKIMKGSGYGALMDIVVGIVGAIVGGFIMHLIGFAGSGGMIYTIIVAVFGAVVLTLIIRLVTKGRVTS
jgi:uncharacterized membrane protein YeaQ/YmgE (transglycosylase-associated protein family)